MFQDCHLSLQPGSNTRDAQTQNRLQGSSHHSCLLAREGEQYNIVEQYSDAEAMRTAQGNARRVRRQEGRVRVGWGELTKP